MVVLLPFGLCSKGDDPASPGDYLALVHFFIKRFNDVWGETIILVTIVLYVGVMTMGADDLGVRYLLPIFPLLFVWCSRIALDLKQRRAGMALLVLLVIWQARAALWAFPNYIPYVNEIAGGAKSGVYYLDDSNVDWGQGLKQAAEYVHSRRLENVELLPFSPFDSPRHYGINRPRAKISPHTE